MPPILSQGMISYRPAMIFIDGGYLREGFKKVIKREIGENADDFNNLQNHIRNQLVYGSIVGELRRTYYYDAIVDHTDPKYADQRTFFDKLQKNSFYEVKLGRCIKANGGYRQKGIDILIAIDMLTKAYQNHYDTAAFLGGDDDFIDLIESVKEFAGKRVYGFYFEHNVSQRLLNTFDMRMDLDYNFPKWFKSD